MTANNRNAEPPATRAKHYHAKTTYTKNYTYITLYILSIIASLVYIGVRIYYIAKGVLRLQIPFNQPVVDTTTCGDLPDDVCTSEYCGNVTTPCDVIQAGELLAQQGINLDNNVIEPDLVNDPQYRGIKELMDAFTYSYWWSIVVLAAEIGGFILVHLSQQMFIRQDTKFYEMAPERINQLREVCLSAPLAWCPKPVCKQGPTQVHMIRHRHYQCRCCGCSVLDVTAVQYSHRGCI